ncbi:hypothetical protein [Kaarinaea lacus]
MQYPVQTNSKSFPRAILMILLIFSLYACGTVPSINTAAVTTTASSAAGTMISGYIVESDGVTPLYDATIAVLSEQASAATNTSGKSCPTPAKPHAIYTCTNEDGSFTLDLSQVRVFPITLTIEKLDEIQEITLTLEDFNSNIGTIAMISEEPASKEKVAVVMDFYNPLQDIQEFLNANPSQTQDVKLQLMNEYQNLYEINSDGRDISYPTFYSLFVDADNNGQADIFNYDVVYINSRQQSDLALLDQSLRQQLLNYISSGGNLYITEWTVELEKEEPSLDQYI